MSFLLQVHNRLEYLRHLIVSLAQARDIDSVLLIFSHDYYDEDINQLITTIDFCKVCMELPQDKSVEDAEYGVQCVLLG